MDAMLNNVNSDAQMLIDSQWPGFEVKCKKCGSTFVKLDNSLGFSGMSGKWGSLDFHCTQCDFTAEIYS